MGTGDTIVAVDTLVGVGKCMVGTFKERGKKLYLYIYKRESLCVCVCLLPMPGQTTGPIDPKFCM